MANIIDNSTRQRQMQENPYLRALQGGQITREQLEQMKQRLEQQGLTAQPTMGQRVGRGVMGGLQTGANLLLQQGGLQQPNTQEQGSDLNQELMKEIYKQRIKQMFATPQKWQPTTMEEALEFERQKQASKPIKSPTEKEFAGSPTTGVKTTAMVDSELVPIKPFRQTQDIDFDVDKIIKSATKENSTDFEIQQATEKAQELIDNALNTGDRNSADAIKQMYNAGIIDAEIYRDFLNEFNKYSFTPQTAKIKSQRSVFGIPLGRPKIQ